MFSRDTLLPSMTINLVVLLCPAIGQGLLANVEAWKIERTVAGGKAGVNQFLSVTSAGEIVAEERRMGSHVTARAPAEQIQKLTAYIKVARQVQPGAGFSSLLVRAGGREYSIEATPEIGTLLQNALETVFKQALAGYWRQSGWKLCKPAAQLTASDIDPPIDQLVFRADGSFSVAWPGGPRTTGPGHVTIPDYDRRYTISLTLGTIRMSVEGGNPVPRDFSGDGGFRINMDHLTLSNVWLGTKQAKQKPDICELMFTKQGRTEKSERR
jgi:hypothetical protein